MEGAKLSSIASDVIMGKDVKIFSLVNLYGCTIGDRTKIGSFVEIQKNVVIGSDCKISSHSFICEGVHIGDKVFVGHGVTFINDLYPEAVREDGAMQTDADWEVVPTYVERRASIGSNSTILCGITIGQNAIVGAGSVVTKDVPPNQIWAGNPARFLRKV
jgi:acetyltransferase-like isoleucine patch superfamily enzyme